MQNWFQTPENQNFTCYLLNLEPLSLGHLFLLKELESPYPDGTLHTEAELRIAAWICSAPWLRSRRILTRWHSGFFRAFWKSVTPLCDFEREHSNFCQYLSANLNGILTKTRISHPSIGPDTYDTPFEWTLLAGLVKRMSYSEAMELPVWIALRLQTATAEGEGKLDVVSDDTLRLFDLVERETVKG